MLRPPPTYPKQSERGGSGRRAECHQQCSGPRQSRSLEDIFFCRTRRDCALRARLHRRGGSASDRTGGVDDLSGVAAQRRHAQWRPRVSRDDSAMACRAISPSTKAVKAWLNAALQAYVQDRLAGLVEAPERRFCSWPVRIWKGRRHGRRQDRRWARAWSPEQIARRLPVDFPDDITMRISHEAIYQALFVQGRGALRRELTACLRTGRVLQVPRARTRRRGKNLVSSEIMIANGR